MMTRNRRRKAAIRAHQAKTGSRYMVARRQLGEPDATTAAPAGVKILPPLKAWTRAIDCQFWAELAAEHGPLMALNISDGPRWWELDDLARKVAGALQDRPSEERGVWINDGHYPVTKREHLPGIAVALDAVGALRRLTVRAVPDGIHCEHASCRRRRGEPPVRRTPPPPAAPAAPRPASVVLGAMLSLAEVMEQHPQLNYSGFGMAKSRDQTPEQHRAELADERTSLSERRTSVLQIATWLQDNVRPIKTPTVGSYGMKHLVEEAIGRNVSNGEFIAAALAIGYPYRYTERPNASFAMSARDVNRIRTAQRTP